MYKRTLSGEIRAGVPRADVYFLFATTIGLLFYVGLSVCFLYFSLIAPKVSETTLTKLEHF